MSYCFNCGKELADQSANFCPNCGKPQSHYSPVKVSKGTPSVITVLCILTIIGSSMGLIKGIYYEAMGSFTSNDNDWLGYLFAFFNLGTLVAAILMLRLNSIGFYTYIVFQVLYISLSIFGVIHRREAHSWYSGAYDPFSLFISAAMVIPSFVFLVLYLTLTAKYFVRPKDQ